MPASRFVVNYSATTGRVRSWAIAPENHETDATLASFVAGPGETQARFAMSQYGDLNAIQALVNSITGIDPNQPSLTTGTTTSSGATTTGSDTSPGTTAPSPAADAYDCWDASGNYVTTVFLDPDGCGDKPGSPIAQITPATAGVGPGWTLAGGVMSPPSGQEPAAVASARKNAFDNAIAQGKDYSDAMTAGQQAAMAASTA